MCNAAPRHPGLVSRAGFNEFFSTAYAFCAALYSERATTFFAMSKISRPITCSAPAAAFTPASFICCFIGPIARPNRCDRRMRILESSRGFALRLSVLQQTGHFLSGDQRMSYSACRLGSDIELAARTYDATSISRRLQKPTGGESGISLGNKKSTASAHRAEIAHGRANRKILSHFD